MRKEGKWHRNSFKRFYGEDKIYFIVTKTKNNFPYFRETIFCDLLLEELKLIKRMKKYKLFAFSIIYDHLNLLIQPGGEYNISQVMFSIKKQFSHNANRVMGHNTLPDIDKCDHHRGLPALPVGAQALGRLQEEQEDRDDGHGRTKHYLYITKLHTDFTAKYKHPQYVLPPFKWQKSFYDHVIRSDQDFETHWRYASYNPAKHGLPETWPYSSEYHEDMLDYYEI